MADLNNGPNAKYFGAPPTLFLKPQGFPFEDGPNSALASVPTWTWRQENVAQVKDCFDGCSLN